MKKYLISAFIPQNKEEKEKYLQYYLKDIKNYDKLNFYIKNQKKIIKFLRNFFILNNNEVNIYLKPISRRHQNNYLYYERKRFWDIIKKMTFEQKFLGEKILIKNIKEFDFYVKFGYRDIENVEGIRLIFEKLKVEMYSTGEYSYIIEINKNSELYNLFE